MLMKGLTLLTNYEGSCHVICLSDQFNIGHWKHIWDHPFKTSACLRGGGGGGGGAPLGHWLKGEGTRGGKTPTYNH